MRQSDRQNPLAHLDQSGMTGLPDFLATVLENREVNPGPFLRDPNRKNHYSRNNYKKMRQMSEQARDKNA
jgi:hypothetical protein